MIVSCVENVRESNSSGLKSHRWGCWYRSREGPNKVLSLSICERGRDGLVLSLSCDNGGGEVSGLCLR